MFSEHVLNGTNSARIQPEAIAWREVMAKLRSDLPQIPRTGQAAAKSLIAEASDALHACASMRKATRKNRKVQKARRAVESVLALFPTETDVVEWAFFLAYSNAALGEMVDEFEQLAPNVSKEARENLRQIVEAVLQKHSARLSEARQRFRQREGDSPSATNS